MPTDHDVEYYRDPATNECRYCYDTHPLAAEVDGHGAARTSEEDAA